MIDGGEFIHDILRKTGAKKCRLCEVDLAIATEIANLEEGIEALEKQLDSPSNLGSE